MMGAHTLKTWATNQAVLALSSGEAEYYAIVKAASVAMGIRYLAADMGITFECPIAIKSDASAAIGIGSRVGIGKVRHIEVTQLWVQEKVVNGEMVIEKVATEDNLADALTKAVDAQIIQKHVLGTGAEIRSDRHHLAPVMDNKIEDVINDQEETTSEEVVGIGGDHMMEYGGGTGSGDEE